MKRWVASAANLVSNVRRVLLWVVGSPLSAIRQAFSPETNRTRGCLLTIPHHWRVRDSCSGVKCFEVKEHRGQRLINTCTSAVHRTYRCVRELLLDGNNTFTDMLFIYTIVSTFRTSQTTLICRKFYFFGRMTAVSNSITAHYRNTEMNKKGKILNVTDVYLLSNNMESNYSGVK